MKSENRAALDGLRTMASIFGMGLLVAACSSGDDDSMPPMTDDDMSGMTGDDMSGTMDDDDMPETMELGAWNALPAGTLDVSDANDVLHAHYDMSGDGHLMAPEPVQPEGTGTATWTGMWSGTIESTRRDSTLAAFGVTQADLQALGGGARITAYFDGSGGVEAMLTYEDTGLEGFNLAEISTDRVPVTGGEFEPSAMLSTVVPIDFGQPSLTDVTIAADLAGEGAFGGTDAEGVAGYIGGVVTFNYGREPLDFGTFQSVFYGTQDDN